jgi:transposase
MSENMQWPKLLVGMDAHTRKLALCLAQWSYGSDPKRQRNFPYVALADMERFYEANIPVDATTIVEATSNAFVIKDRLEKIGRKVEIVKADALKAISQDDRITDLIDAQKLTVAYARGASLNLVRHPDRATLDQRALFGGERMATKETTRASNRLWALCNEYGLPLPKKTGDAKVSEVRTLMKARPLSDWQKFRIEDEIATYEKSLERKAKYKKELARTVMSDGTMRQLLQLCGVKHTLSFALVAFTGDVNDFMTAKNLVSYYGLNPRVHGSGEVEERNKKKGRNGKTSKYGRRDVKALLIEAAQSVVRTQKTSALGKWAARMLARQKPYNKVVCAVARKIVCYVWHILKGHPVPSRESEAFFTRKAKRIYREIGKNVMSELGFPTTAALVDQLVVPLYAHLPEETEQQETPSLK